MSFDKVDTDNDTLEELIDYILNIKNGKELQNVE